MAIAVVRTKQTPAGTNASLAITAAAKGNVLVAFIAQTGTEAAPTLTGYAVNATSAQAATASNRVFVAIKEAVGGEVLIEPTPGVGGTIQGISYAELSGASTTIDTIVASNNRAKAKTATTEPVTTATAGDAVLTGWARGGNNSGGQEPWTGTGPLENVETASTRCFAGYAVFAGTLTGATFTANWSAEAVSTLLTIALKPAGGSSFSGATISSLAAQQSVAGRKIATGTIAQQFITQRAPEGHKLSTGASAQQVAISSSLIGAKRMAGVTSQQVAISGSAAGAKRGIGSVVNTIGFADALAGVPRKAGAAIQSTAFLNRIVGVRTGGGEEVFSGPIIESLGFVQQVAGSKRGAGAVSQVAPIRSSIAGAALRQGAVSSRLALSQAAAGRKAGRAGLTQVAALSGAVTGRKRSRGSVTQQIAFVKEWVIIVLPTNGIATATVALRYVAAAEVAVQDAAAATVQTDQAEGEVQI